MLDQANRTFICSVVFIDLVGYSKKTVTEQIRLKTSLTTNLFLNSLQISFTNAATNYLTANTNTFFSNVPGVLLPGETYSDVIFSVGINPAPLAVPGDLRPAPRRDRGREQRGGTARGGRHR